MTWVLIIVTTIYGRGGGVTTIPNYPTEQSCLASARFAKKQHWTADAYCVVVPPRAEAEAPRGE